jgi:hypothetical protein
MKNKKILLIIAFVLSSLFFLDCFMFPESHLFGKTSLETTNSKGFAVVELFTSEGCSSCPAADELMAKLQQDVKNKNIYLLAYHVDYWDRLGWKDRFSSEQFTSRQQEYQQWLNLNIMYTPQFVVNGSTQFAGDHEGTLYRKVADALQTKVASEIHLKTNTSKDSISVDYKTNIEQKNTSLLLAVVQKKATTQVERGENSGALLHHVQIVNQVHSLSFLKKEGNIVIPKPKKFDTENYELIGFVQNNDTGVITSATSAQFN